MEQPAGFRFSRPENARTAMQAADWPTDDQVELLLYLGHSLLLALPQSDVEAKFHLVRERLAPFVGKSAGEALVGAVVLLAFVRDCVRETDGG
jgi:hypothetical protein